MIIYSKFELTKVIVSYFSTYDLTFWLDCCNTVLLTFGIFILLFAYTELGTSLLLFVKDTDL